MVIQKSSQTNPKKRRMTHTES